jgi:pantoate--beta-alanine ligase
LIRPNVSETLEMLAAPRDLRRRVKAWKRDGLTVGLVPTMGALHAGHLSLVRLAREHADRVVVSVFVNPTQFGPDEDLELYPRHPDDDAALLSGHGCDLVFLPEVETIYPPGHSVFVDLDESAAAPSRGLEGTERPGHFRGVATVVTKLFNLVQPELAVFGDKDAQQLAVIRALVRDLHLGVEILSAPTVREPDGLAMSSRNAYLSDDERRAAVRVYATLEAARRMILAGERDADAVRRQMTAALAAEPRFSVDYAEVVATDTFQPVSTIDRSVTLPVAIRLGRVRLIDNIRINLDDNVPSNPSEDRPMNRTGRKSKIHRATEPGWSMSMKPTRSPGRFRS